MKQHTIEQDIELKLMQEENLYGKENLEVRRQVKAENRMVAPVWSEPSEPGLLGMIWGLVKGVLAGKENEHANTN